MKKALSIILALVLTFSLASSAFIVSAEGNTLTVGEGGEYSSLSTAISKATAGDTLKLLSDLSVDGTTAGITVSKSLTIDLGTNTLTSTNKRLFNVAANSNATLTIKNGSVVISASNSDIPIAVRATNDLVLEDLTVTAISTSTYGFVTLLSPSTADPNNITVKNCNITSSTYMFSDNNASNAAWNLYIYNSDLAVSANSIILKKDTAKTYDAIIYSGHIKNALLNTAHYPNLTIAEGSYMTTTENGSKDTAVTAFAQEYWVYTESSEPAEEDGTTTDALTMKAEASIRLNVENGIRFYTTYDENKISGTVVEKGTLIGPKNLIGTYLTNDDVKDGNAVEIPYLAEALWDNNEFVGSIVGINSWNYNREFTARAYVKLDDGTYLYSATATTKTVADIADAFISDPDSNYATLDTETKSLVDAWAQAND